MMQQYLRLKAEHPEILMFYRMGDFYELFYDDARRRTACWTSPHHAGQSRGEPMVDGRRAGHAGRAIPARLIRLGESVAIAEQVGTWPRPRGRWSASGCVVTPGTITDAELLSDKSDTLLLARASCRATAWPG